MTNDKSITNIAYICDGKACGEDCTFPKCQHTTDINHALNFEKLDEGTFMETIEFTFTDTSEDKKQVIENLKKYKQTGSRMSEWWQDTIYKTIELIFYMIVIYTISWFSNIDVNTVAFWYILMIVLDIRLMIRKHTDGN